MAGGVLGPLVAGALLERDLSTTFVLVVVAGLVLTAWLFLRLEQIISPTVNGLAVTATDEQPVR